MKKRLEILLEGLKGFEEPKLKLEQYVTPPSLTAFIINHASILNELDFVVDLGCGTGMIGIAVSLAGGRAVGVDIDANALRIAKENADKYSVSLDLIIADVEDFYLKGKNFTTIMNPPFGIQRKHADRAFLKKAMEFSKTIYSIHSAGSEKFVERLCGESGFTITHKWFFSIPLRRTYEFHEKEFKYVPVEVYRIERKG